MPKSFADVIKEKNFLSHYDKRPIPLGGGTESTFKLESTDPDYPPIVLKKGASHEALQLEILCEAIYAQLGVRVPESIILDPVPDNFAEFRDDKGKGLVQISERKDFVIHALLGNINLDEDDSFDIDRQGFESINEAELKAQVVGLLQKEFELEAIVWALSDELEMSDVHRERFLQLISDRFDTLAMHYCPEVPRYGKLDKKAKAGETAAGILTYKKGDNGEIYVLMGLRDDCDCWECFGGKSDAIDQYLYRTAAREVAEESSGEVNRNPARLIHLPFHDLVTKKNGKPFVYRMYLQEDPGLDLTKLKDSEHREYRWIPVADLNEAVNSSSQTVVDVYGEGKSTVSLVNGSDTIDLYPEFYELLKQTEASEIGISLGKNADNAESSQAQTEPKKPLRHFHSPEEIKWQYTESVWNHLKLLEELKQRFAPSWNHLKVLEESKQRFATRNTGQAENVFERMSQSELQMWAILREEKIPWSDDLRVNVTKTINTILGLHAIVEENTVKEALIDQCVRLIQIEKNADPQQVFFYHGCSKEIAFAYKIYSALYQKFRADKEWNAFRVNNEYFNEFMTIEQFIVKFEGTRGVVDNNLPGYNEAAISANWGLFGSYTNNSSCTLLYFLRDETRREVALEGLLKAFLPETLNETHLAQLLKLYHRTDAGRYGFLYQISMQNEDAERCAYCADIGGPVNEYNGTYSPVKVKESLVSDLGSMSDSKQISAIDYLLKMQVRLMIPPDLKMRVNSISGADIDTTIVNHTKSDESLELIDDLVHELLFQNSEMIGRLSAARVMLDNLARVNRVPSVPKATLLKLKHAFDIKDQKKIIEIINQNEGLMPYAASRILEGKDLILLLDLIKKSPNILYDVVFSPSRYEHSSFLTSGQSTRGLLLIHQILLHQDKENILTKLDPSFFEALIDKLISKEIDLSREGDDFMIILTNLPEGILKNKIKEIMSMLMSYPESIDVGISLIKSKLGENEWASLLASVPSKLFFGSDEMFESVIKSKSMVLIEHLKRCFPNNFIQKYISIHNELHSSESSIVIKALKGEDLKMFFAEMGNGSLYRRIKVDVNMVVKLNEANCLMENRRVLLGEMVDLDHDALLKLVELKPEIVGELFLPLISYIFAQSENTLSKDLGDFTKKFSTEFFESLIKNHVELIFDKPRDQIINITRCCTKDQLKVIIAAAPGRLFNHLCKQSVKLDTDALEQIFYSLEPGVFADHLLNLLALSPKLPVMIPEKLFKKLLSGKPSYEELVKLICANSVSLDEYSFDFFIGEIPNEILIMNLPSIVRFISKRSPGFDSALNKLLERFTVQTGLSDDVNAKWTVIHSILSEINQTDDKKNIPTGLMQGLADCVEVLGNEPVQDRPDVDHQPTGSMFLPHGEFVGKNVENAANNVPVEPAQGNKNKNNNNNS